MCLERNLDEIRCDSAAQFLNSRPLSALSANFLLTCRSRVAHNLHVIRGKMRIMISCGTKDDTHLPTNRLYHEALLRHGVDHT